MKKETIVLIILIVCLSGYLFFKTDNRDNYTLPEIAEITPKNISSILIEQQQDTVLLKQNDSSWTVSEKEYPADISMVEVLLETVKNLKLSALVSQSQDFRRYKLDKDNRIRVTVFEAGKETLKFNIGKEAPTGNHTFTMVGDDTAVYHADGNFRLDFDQTADAFRDKMILKVNKPAVKGFTVTQKEKTLTVRAEKPSGSEDDQTVWTSADGSQQDSAAISNFLSSISFLRCDGYRDDKSKQDAEGKKAVFTIDIDADQKISLKLFKFYDSEKIFGISSLNDYVFRISEFDYKEILKNIDQLFGTEPEKNN